MHVISRKKLNDFADIHPDTRSALASWYKTMKSLEVANFAGLRSYFPSADKVGKLTVFNIGGNKVRLVAALHYNRKRIYIRDVLTHSEYDENKWKEQQ
ncbi:MAG TPA: type II toxin-antitoxin system HigB family toxin [Candidatus Kapabacteria bacterium]